jgi:hypothetical protein
MAQWATEGTCLSGFCVEEDLLYAAYQMPGFYTAPSIGVSGEEQQASGGSIIGSAIVRGVNGP